MDRLQHCRLLQTGDDVIVWSDDVIMMSNIKTMMLYGSVLPLCTLASCPVMSATSKYIYNHVVPILNYKKNLERLKMAISGWLEVFTSPIFWLEGSEYVLCDPPRGPSPIIYLNFL